MVTRSSGSSSLQRRVAWVAAIVLALVGVFLISMASCSSTPGPPQPGAAAAGVIDPSTTDQTSVTSTSESRPFASGTATRKTSSSSQTATPTRPIPATVRSSPVAIPKGTAVAPADPKPLTRGPILAASPPVSLAIPKIGVTSDLVDLGINQDGTVQVPSLDDPDSKAGWYKLSPTPGAVGPSIILGHIDSKKYGPGVFYNLGRLIPGDTVDVTRKDGTVAVFRIDGVRSYPKSNFPTFQVYGNLNYAGLRLITCGGDFDPDKGSYESNIVAYATLVSSHSR